MSFDPILWDYGPNFEGPDDPNSIAGSGRHANLSLKDRWPGSRQGVRGFFDGQHIVDLVTVNLDPDLIAIAALSGTGIAVRTAANAWALRTLQAPAAGLTITNPAGVAGDMTFALANDLAALEGLASTGIAVRTAANTWAQRTIAVGSGLAIADAGGVAGDPTVTLDATLVSLAAYNTNGLLTQTAADTFTGRTLQAPAAGFTITNPAGIAGDPTFVLANDLAALEGLGSTGIAVRSAANTWVQRAIAAGTGISVTNGDGVSGNPSVALDTSYTNGLYLALAGGTMTGTLTTRTSTTGAGTEAIVIPVGGKPASTVTGALYNDGSLHYTKAAGSISVGGAIFDYSTNATTGTTETDMFAPSIPANMLAANGDKLEFVFSGTITGHASRTREIRMYWGSNVLIDNGATVYASDADWTARGSLIRASSTTARVEITFFVNGVLPVMDYVALATLDFTTANTLKITGQSGAGSGASDITGRMGWVKFIPAAAL